MRNAGATLQGRRIIQLLDQQYPNITTSLMHKGPFQLLIATILSAQCTDTQVNSVTRTLFSRYPNAISLDQAPLRDVEKIIHSTGFFHIKANRIKAVASEVLNNFHGRVPETMQELTSLPGVGRKTANIVLSVGFGKIEGIAVDTHVSRLARRIGLSHQRSPERIELDLMRITPADVWPRLSILLILHGRKICKARRPSCNRCALMSECNYFAEKYKNKIY